MKAMRDEMDEKEKEGKAELNRVLGDHAAQMKKAAEEHSNEK